LVYLYSTIKMMHSPVNIRKESCPDVILCTNLHDACRRYKNRFMSKMCLQAIMFIWLHSPRSRWRYTYNRHCSCDGICLWHCQWRC